MMPDSPQYKDKYRGQLQKDVAEESLVTALTIAHSFLLRMLQILKYQKNIQITDSVGVAQIYRDELIRRLQSSYIVQRTKSGWTTKYK